MKNKHGIRKFTFIYGVLLVGFSVYVLLDSFVIPHRYTKAFAASEETEQTEQKKPKSEKETGTVSADDSQTKRKGMSEKEDKEGRQGSGKKGKPEHRGISGDSAGRKMKKRPDRGSEGGDAGSKSGGTGESQSYSSDGLEITVRTDRINDTDVHVADVRIASPDSLKTALADDTYGRNITASTSEIAEENDAVLAINGDFYGSRQSGYVIRNGVLYRDKALKGSEDLVIYKDGSFEIAEEDDVTAEELLEKGAWQVFSFGPALVENGETAVEEGEEVGKAMYSNPRTAIGIIDDLHYVFVVSDGRTDSDEGLTLSSLAEYMQGLGVKTAYNLDGGGSSTMVFKGEVVNEPTTGGKSISERSVSDIVYIK